MPPEDNIALFSYILAAALIAPFTWWAKQHTHEVGLFIASLGGLLY